MAKNIKNEPVSTRTALVIGATSSLALSLCRGLAEKGWSLILCARDVTETKLLAHDLRIRYEINISTLPIDLSDKSLAAEEFVENIIKSNGVPDAIYFLAGTMGNMETPETSGNIDNVTITNFLNPVKIISLLAQKMKEREKPSTIAIVSSVAGDRGRQSNFVYGSSKAALSTYAAGLRNKYNGSNVHVLTVKPGFVDTPLTYDMDSPLIASRDDVAHSIIKAAENRQNILYTPFIWRFIMLIITHIPEFIFKRLKL